MGLIHCVPEYLPGELHRVFSAIDQYRPSLTDLDEAIATTADHWGELTGVHPFRDGNSRTQRFFFTEYLRDRGWALDWTRIDDTAVHAARHVAMATTDSSYLAAALRPGAAPVTHHSPGGASAATAGKDARRSVDIFRQMMAHKRSGGTGADWWIAGTVRE